MLGAAHPSIVDRVAFKGPGYFGFPLNKLDHDLTQESSQFLPPLNQLRETTIDPDAKQLQLRLADLSRRCTSSAIWPETHGATGAMLSSLFKPFTEAYMNGWAFQTPVMDNQDLCGTGDLTCIGIERMSNCTRKAGVLRSSAPEISLNHGKAKPPPEFAGKGLFWWTAQSLGRIIKPTVDAAAHIRELQALWGWNKFRPVLGVHIRQGDTCFKGIGKIRKGRRCDPPSFYLKNMRPVMDKYGARSVFVASDSQAAIEHLKANLDVPVFSVELNRTEYGQWHNLDKAIAKGALDMVKDRSDVLTDIRLLSEADVLLGKFTSNIPRHALALGTFNRGGGHIVPYVSLDAAWCADYEEMSGRSIIPTWPTEFKC